MLVKADAKLNVSKNILPDYLQKVWPRTSTGALKFAKTFSVSAQNEVLEAIFQEFRAKGSAAIGKAETAVQFSDLPEKTKQTVKRLLGAKTSEVAETQHLRWLCAGCGFQCQSKADRNRHENTHPHTANSRGQRIFKTEARLSGSLTICSIISHQVFFYILYL